ncbi:hypothetical protein V1503_01010 [Bacillus sp. SCS-151]|uniref:hypothetical protein n=1 Tax=Nanhaiella sioensis TaxID=3115293 RepID=UPI00397B1AF8
MGAYVSKSSCCGSTKTLSTEKIACCDCPMEIDSQTRNINLTCGQSMTVFGGNFRGLLSGSIAVGEDSACGLRVTITTNGVDVVLDIPLPNDPENSNTLSIAYTNVSNITVACMSDGGGDCIGNYSYKLIDRCISPSLPSPPPP